LVVIDWAETDVTVGVLAASAGVAISALAPSTAAIKVSRRNKKRTSGKMRWTPPYTRDGAEVAPVQQAMSFDYRRRDR
jgi:hypothetical protein